MKTPSVSRPLNWRRLLLWMLAVMLLTPLLVVGGLALIVVRSLHVGPEVAALRDSVAPGISAGWHKQVEVNIGRLPLLLARAGLHYAPVEAEARLALRAAKGAEVLVYDRTAGDVAADRAETLRKADEVMTFRGWYRSVGVMQGNQLVAVYVPRSLDSAHEVTACVLVVDPQKVVIASARTDLEPLLELVRSRPEWHEHLHLVAARETPNRTNRVSAGAGGI
jgi:hypothetical protein